MEKIFWVDLEMTGLDVQECVIIEFAAVVTDLSMTELDRYHAVVYQPQSELDKMDEWNRTTHGQSGLLARIPDGKPLALVEDEVLAILKKHWIEDAPVLAGNSIHQDRKFIDRYMPKIADYLHYRMIDVSSFKQIFKNLYGLTMDKSECHRALDDINESIAELQFYLQFVKVPPKDA